jgi:long-chain fatty acid transport protein
MADVQWTHWKRFQSLVLRFDEGPISNTQSTTENFKDSYRVALGTAYRYNDCTTLRLGVAYDKSPVRDKFRTIRIPDSDRTWASIGAQYRLNECMAVELGYAHLFFKRAPINESAPVANGPDSVQVVQTLRGRNSMAADIVGIQFTWTLG